MTVRARRTLLLAAAAAIAVGCCLSGVTATAGPVLPAGGKITAGSASIGAPTGGTMTIDQSSAKAIIDWSSFSIGQGGAVAFQNGSGATLNRVSGTQTSAIDGTLNGTGSVYLINPNGVIIGRSGVVDVGAAFVASSLALSDNNFLGGAPLAFKGASKASVINLGRIGALGGDVALIAAAVDNHGAITAPKGEVGLISGYSIVMRDQAQDDGKFTVLVGGADTATTNAGAIVAAMAELKAEGGNVYALAGNLGGVIRATGVSANDGKVLLIAKDGGVSASGEIDAARADGSGGEVETSGAHVDFTGLKVKGRTWLIDPTDDTIDAAQAATIESNLATTNVTVRTTASGDGGRGDIIVAAPITWGSSHGTTLTLSAIDNITVDAPLIFGGAAGAGLTLDAANALAINANVTVKGKGAVTLDYDASSATNLRFGGGAALTYANADGSAATSSAGGSLTINGQAYTLLYTLAESGSTGPDTGSADVAGIDHAGDAGDYALATNLDGSGTTFTAAPAGSISKFAGVFDGLGHTVSNLTISDATVYGYAGLFGAIDSGGLLRDVGLVGGSNTSVFAYAGGLAGVNGGTIIFAYATGTDSGGGFVGGLVGENEGSITSSYASGPVSGSGDDGGLVGINDGVIVSSHATGAVSGYGYADGTGGLVGENDRTITSSYATGAVSGFDSVGGLVGFNISTITSSYAAGAVSGNFNVGGLVGYVYSGAITSSYATGAATGVSAYLSTGRYVLPTNIGGLAGDNVGAITSSYATGPASGDAVVGGLAGENDGAVTSSYATGEVSGVNGSGGLVGHNSGTIIDGYYDAGTTGRTLGTQTDGSTGLTTAQLQAQLPPGFASSVWAQIAGKSYPYLLWRFPSAPGLIAGTVYDRSAVLAGVTVNGLMDGADEGSVQTGANGYYQFLLAPGAIEHADVLAYLTGPKKGEAFQDHLTGSATDLDIHTNALNATTSGLRISDLVGALTDAMGSTPSSRFLFAVSGGHLAPSNGASLLIHATSSEFIVDQPLSLGTGSFALDADGGIVMQGASAGGINLTAAQGRVWIGGPLSATGDVSVTASRSVAVNHPITGADITLNIGDGAQPGQMLTLAAPLTATGTVTLNSSDPITQYSAGRIIANRLTGSSGTSGQTNACCSGSTVLSASNQISYLGPWTADGGFTLRDLKALNVDGTLASPVGDLSLSATSLHLRANLDWAGDITLASTLGDIDIGADVGGLSYARPDTVSLSAFGAVTSQPYSGMRAALLNATALKGITLTGSANRIGALGVVNPGSGLADVTGVAK